MSRRNGRMGKSQRRLERLIDAEVGWQPPLGWNRAARRMREFRPGRYAESFGLRPDPILLPDVDHVGRVTRRPELSGESPKALAAPCNAVRSLEMMDLHLEANMGEGLHNENTGFTTKVSRFSQPAHFPIPGNARIVNGERGEE